jgi:hypothetical protein
MGVDVVYCLCIVIIILLMVVRKNRKEYTLNKVQSEKIRHTRALRAFGWLKEQGKDPNEMTDKELMETKPGYFGKRSISALRKLSSNKNTFCPHCGMPVELKQNRKETE